MLKAEMFDLNGGEFINLGELYHCDENTYETAIVTFDDDDVFYLAGDTKDKRFAYQTIEDIQELINKVSEMSSQTLLN